MQQINNSSQEKGVVVVALGAFPPPVHGMALLNAAVRDRLRAAGVEVQVLNIAAPRLGHHALGHLNKLIRVFRAYWQLLTSRASVKSSLYMSVSGGWGQGYELGFIAVARLRGLKCVLHHHSFAYLGRARTLTACLVWLAGRHSVHVTLSENMGNRLRSIYNVQGKVFAVSNASLLLGESSLIKQCHARYSTLVIGFLSNISCEKGIFTFLDLVAAAIAEGVKLSARIAGPFQDFATEQKVRHRLAELPMVEYVGSVYGHEKLDFFRSLDAFIFPTRYVNEAEPLVILEAMQQELPVIAYGRGAIPEVLDASCGLVVSPGDDFTEPALALLREWAASPEVLAQAHSASAGRFRCLRTRGQLVWAQVEAILSRIPTSGHEHRIGMESGDNIEH